MASILLFRFLDPERVEWYSDGNGGVCTPAELVGQAVGCRLLLVAPGESVFLTRVSVPGSNRATWLKVIPYSLEDNLADDVEDLHFALGTAGRDEAVPVAVIRHATLRHWLERCTEAGVTPSWVIPDPLLLPWTEGEWSLLLETERVVVRCGLWEGFATERESLAPLLSLALHAAAKPPAAVRVWGDDAVSDLAGLGLEPALQEPAGALAVLASGYQPGAGINLLQGAYGPQAHLSKWLRPWRAAAVLVAAWLGLQVAMQGAEYWRLQQEQTQLRAEMERIYKDAVPDALKIVNPRVQLENHLLELRKGGDGGGMVFLDLLLRGGQPLQNLPGVTLRGLRYKTEQLDLDLESNTLETLDQLKERYGQQPELNAQMRTTKREGKVESQITLKKTSS
jgi:general secretion pathway protein L